MKFLVGTLLVLGSACIQAESYSSVSKVKGISVGTDFARIRLDTMGPAEGCDAPKLYKLDTTNGKEMFSTILTAKATDSQISFQLVGCEGNMPNITHVYLCDKEFCN